ncbi:MAG TPA: HNH endonuclease signature motif containing protein [Xanthomonadaceae bacterium]|nr:HNH endonuclease signature motif containing protein [Xanthomonadaceae bacterium]
MTAKAVQFVLVVRYNLSAHRATYGRLHGPPSTYTKDFLQLSRKKEFLEAIEKIFPPGSDQLPSIPIVYRWSNGSSARGAFVYHSSDRPHLSWETSVGAPPPWKMTLRPSPETVQTIPGNPSHTDPHAADSEHGLLSERGAGHPYLVAVKLVDEESTFHLRVYLRDASPSYAWADFGLIPEVVREISPGPDSRAAFGWVVVPNGSLFFDPNLNHDAWHTLQQLKDTTRSAVASRFKDGLLLPFDIVDDDASAETLAADEQQVEEFESQIRKGKYSVPDVSSTVKTRGSAQRAFSKEVRANYGGACAITGINSRHFLVASHIVPWSKDETIRLDPANGICLSLLVDKAFELGFLQIEDDLSIRIEWQRVGDDVVLRGLLQPYEGKMLRIPISHPPTIDYLRRRRELVTAHVR